MGCKWFTAHSPSICLTNRSHLGVGSKEGPNKSRKWFKIFTSPHKVCTTTHGSDGFHGVNSTYKKES
jgi:hypothetical protein